MKRVIFAGNFLMQRKHLTNLFSLIEMIDLNSIYSERFRFLSFKMEKFQKSSFDWEILNRPFHYIQDQKNIQGYILDWLIHSTNKKSSYLI